MILILIRYNFITIAFRLPFHIRASLIGIKIRFIVIISISYANIMPNVLVLRIFIGPEKYN